MARKGVSALLAFALAALCLALGSCKLPASKSVDLLPGVMTFAVDYVADGGTLAVTLPVENQGSAAAAAFTVEFYLAATSAFNPSVDASLGTAAGASVPANSTGTVNASLLISNDLDINEVRYVYAVVDSTGAVDESDETNNQSTTGTAAAVLIYDDEDVSPTYDVIVQTYLGSDPSKTAGIGVTDTLMGLYRDDATHVAHDSSASSDFSIINASTLGPGTYYVLVISTGTNGPYALSVRTGNIISSDLPRFTDMTDVSQDTWEIPTTDDDPKPNLLTTPSANTTIPTRPDPLKVGSALSRYSAANDWDWFTFVLP